MARRFTVIFFAQIRFLDPGNELFSADDGLTDYLIANALATNHLLNQGFAICLSGFVRVSAKISKYKIIANEVFFFSFLQVA